MNESGFIWCVHTSDVSKTSDVLKIKGAWSWKNQFQINLIIL